MNRDLQSLLGPVVAIAPAANRTASVDGVDVDLRGWGSAMAVVHFGAITDGGWTPKLQESDDGSTYTDVAAADLSGSFSEALAANDDTIQKVSYLGTKRYIRVSVTESTASTTGAIFGATVVRGHPQSTSALA